MLVIEGGVILGGRIRHYEIKTKCLEKWLQLKETADIRFENRVQDCATLGQLVARVVSNEFPIRPTKTGKEHPLGPVISTTVHQQDSYRELVLILQTQVFSDSKIQTICEAVFHQNKPTIPKSRVGECALIPNEIRATRASLEFQEFRLRAQIANLRVGREKRTLSEQEYDSVFALLWGWTSDTKPQWIDVAEVLNVEVRELVKPTLDDSDSTSPLTNVTRRVVENLNKKSPLYMWWEQADDDNCAEFIEVITDLSGEENEIVNSDLATFIESWDEDIFSQLEKISKDLPTGRAAYSRKALQQLLNEMRATKCDAHSAIRIAFSLPADWKPPKPTFYDRIEQPVVQRVNTLVHRYISTAILKWGVPESITIEHVRTAFLGPTALADYNAELTSNTRRRNKVREELIQQGIQSPTSIDLRRYQCVQRQNSQCLYCGTNIGITTCELDHILAKSNGGSNRSENLVAVCKVCNQAKGKLPFKSWSEQSTRQGVSLKEAQQRVDTWLRGTMSVKQFNQLKRGVKRRLSLTQVDELDERTLESTAYAAREMRARIESLLETKGTEGAACKVRVFSGAATSEARKAGGVDKRLLLRGEEYKSRFDRRHHAIDAAVLTTITNYVAEVLSERRTLINETRYVQKYEINPLDYEGNAPERVAMYRRWKQQIHALGDILFEAINRDDIAVARPLRLTPKVGAVHADTIEPLVYKHVNDKWTSEEVRRIVRHSDRIHLLQIESSMSATCGHDFFIDAIGIDLPVDSKRQVETGLPEAIAIYPSNAAYLPVRGGAAKIGDTIQYAQIYAWEDKDAFSFGMIRLYTGEFAHIDFDKSTDILSTLPPSHSQAIQTANPKLVKRINSGDALYIGWIALNDEIRLDVNHFMSHSVGKLGAFLNELSEDVWTISGFFDNSTVSIVPAYLSREGISDQTADIVRRVLEDMRIPTSINVLLNSPNCTIIRRTILGKERWKGEGLPVSWNPLEAARKVFQNRHV